MIAIQANAGRSGARHRARLEAALKEILGRFAAADGGQHTATVSSSDLERWHDALKAQPKPVRLAAYQDCGVCGAGYETGGTCGACEFNARMNAETGRVEQMARALAAAVALGPVGGPVFDELTAEEKNEYRRQAVQVLTVGEQTVSGSCSGFPDRCPNLRQVEPVPLGQLGGIRCGCFDDGDAA
jgi:hypothetical protein